MEEEALGRSTEMISRATYLTIHAAHLQADVLDGVVTGHEDLADSEETRDSDLVDGNCPQVKQELKQSDTSTQYESY